MWKKEQTANERNRFFWKVKDRLSHYLKMEKMLIVVCCITYTIVMLIIGHVFNHRLLEVVTNASGEIIVGSKEYPVGSYIGDMTLFGNRKNAYDIERLNNIKSVIN